MAQKNRTDIPQELAARVLFAADRTCCVCRTRGKPVQIHHIDDDPSNQDLRNLGVLCFDCHRETQLRGGFDRKLDSDQVILYRDDWNRLVERRRSRETAAREASRARDKPDLELATSLAEIYREANAYDELAIHYDILGNTELRDKYIALAIENDPSDDTVIFLRGLQGRKDLIPGAVIERHLLVLARETNWHNRARALRTVGRNVEAVYDYIRSIQKSLNEKSYFSAAFYLKELSASGLLNDLFIEALKDARERDDLWWQVRVIQELGWDDELRELLFKHETEIEAMSIEAGGPAAQLKGLLALARGDSVGADEIRKEEARAYARDLALNRPIK